MDKKVIIKANNLCKSFTNGNLMNHVLKNVNLEIYAGDFTVVMGSSGSGKSTLLYSLSTMDQPTSGQVFFKEKDISTLNELETAKLRSMNVSYVFQSINLLNDLTAFENISYPAYLTESKSKVNAATTALLKQFGLYEERNKYPRELSGGQQQRIAIARAVVTSPELLFADEPTGALNSASGKQVLDLLTDLNRQGQSVVMVTHDIKACIRGNRLLYISDGHITGELYLGNYNEKDKTEREQKIFSFLESHNW